MIQFQFLVSNFGCIIQSCALINPMLTQHTTLCSNEGCNLLITYNFVWMSILWEREGRNQLEMGLTGFMMYLLMGFYPFSVKDLGYKT